MAPRPFAPGRRRPMTSMHQKPQGLHCDACALRDAGTGFVPAGGPSSRIALIGEAPGYDEVAQGAPFIGAAGSMLTRVLRIVGKARETYRIDNVIRCFPGDVTVEASGIQKGYRRWYVGELVTVTTPSGELTGTPNHPTLTQRGWVPLGQITQGDYLVRGRLHPREGWNDPHIENRPAPFHEVFDALAQAGVRERVVGSGVDFHGDGSEREVDVVSVHSLLRDWNHPTRSQGALDVLLKATFERAGHLQGVGSGSFSPVHFVPGNRPAARGPMSGADLIRAFLRGELLPRAQPARAAVANDTPTPFQRFPHGGHPYGRLTSQIAVGLPSSVTPAEVQQVTRRDFSGHVYNLSTASGEYLANGFIVHNCVPPEFNIARFPTALDTCRYHEATLAEGPEVVVALGGTATKKLLGFPFKMEGFSIEDFHGTVTRDPTNRFWVVPTFHPSYLQRGATNLMGVSAFDIQRAHDVLEKGWPADPAQLWLDPPVAWFAAWADQYIAAATQDPYAYPLAVDIETPEKGADEGGLVGSVNDATYQITRVNFSCGPDEGITVPHEGAYLPIISRVLAGAAVKYFWYKGYDYPRLRAAGHAIDNLWSYDCMWAWKALQSDLPMGLGFAAPFFSTWGAWKHLSKGPAAEPVKYAGVDGLQTRRTGDGIMGDLIAQGRFDVFFRQMHRFHAIVLQPATDVGVPIDRARLLAFKAKLDGEASRLLHLIADQVPESLCPLAPKAGLTTPPKPGDVYTKARATTKKGDPKKDAPDPLKLQLYQRARVVEQLVLREVWCCRTCGKTQVLKSHKCQPGLPGVAEAATPELVKAVASVPRWFWQEPFNPDSPDQLLAYALAKGHKPGKSKQTGEDAMDKETLSRLVRETGDPLYAGVLDYRAVAKVRGTYVVATEQRMDDQDRLHGTFSFKPSTMRLCVAAGTYIDVVRDVEQYPHGIPIEAVEPGMWAYTFDENRKLTLRRVLARMQTGTNVEVLRVHWMSGFGSGRRFGYVDLTPEHRVRLVDGSYREAQALLQGDRTLALTRGISVDGYARLWATGRQQEVEHRFVHRTLTGERHEHIHHLNHRKLDNRPENLSGRTARAHLSYHGMNLPPAVRAVHRQNLLARLGQSGGSLGPRTPRLKLTREWLVKELAMPDIAGHPTRLARKHRLDYSTLMKYIVQHDVACHRRNTRPGPNHVVVFIERRMELVNVYDLEIEETHNFIANEVCVHNSAVNPNLQNVVADKGGKESLAAGFRKCVVAKGRMVEAGSGWEDLTDDR